MRRNWEEYGNPDGIRSFALGVALPSWMVSSGNRAILLAMYCVVFGVGLPLLVRQWWGKSKKYTKSGLRHSSMAHFFHELRENSSLKKVLEILAAASEFQEEMSAAIKPLAGFDAKPWLRSLEERLDPNGHHYEPPKKLPNERAALVHALLHCHFHRVSLDGGAGEEVLVQTQRYIVAKCAQLAQGIIQIAVARQWLHPALNCMNISQMLVQAVWDRDLAVLQLPFISFDLAKQCAGGKRPLRSVADVLDMPEAERQRLFLRSSSSLSEEQLAEALQVAQSFPIIKADTVNFCILGQESITPGGLITCQVRLGIEFPTLSTTAASVEVSPGSDGKPSSVVPDLEKEVQTFEFDEDGNLLDDPGKKLSSFSAADIKPIYCPRFPTVKRPSWWVMLVNKNNTNFVATPIKIHDLVDSKTVTLQFPAPPRPMPVSLLLVVKSDSVVGVDLVQEVKFTVVAPSPDAAPVERWEISGEEEEQSVRFDDD